MELIYTMMKSFENSNFDQLPIAWRILRSGSWDQMVTWKIGFKIDQRDNLRQVKSNKWGWLIAVWHVRLSRTIGGNFS